MWTILDDINNDNNNNNNDNNKSDDDRLEAIPITWAEQPFKELHVNTDFCYLNYDIYTLIYFRLPS